MILDALRDARALLFPVDCAGCNAPDRGVCPACTALLNPAVTPRRTPAGLVAHTAVRYEGEVRRVILALKEEGRTGVAWYLARPFGAAVRAALDEHPGAIVAPVPSSAMGYRRRGFDPVRLLLRKSGVAFVSPLVAVRQRGAQKTLGREDRAANLHGAFAARRFLAGRTVILVDDVLTTGATLDEAARAISDAGGVVAGAAALAFTPRLHRTRDIPEGDDYGGD